MFIYYLGRGSNSEERKYDAHSWNKSLNDQEIMAFDHVFSEEDSNETIFRAKILDLIRTVLDGVNITVMAYGQTSSGKTFTMQGTKREPGIISNSILFNSFRSFY